MLLLLLLSSFHLQANLLLGCSTVVFCCPDQRTVAAATAAVLLFVCYSVSSAGLHSSSRTTHIKQQWWRVHIRACSLLTAGRYNLNCYKAHCQFASKLHQLLPHPIQEQAHCTGTSRTLSTEDHAQVTAGTHLVQPFLPECI